MRESPALSVIAALLQKGLRIKCYDPVAMPNAQKILATSVEYALDPWDALKGASVAVILTEWDVFKTLDLDRVKQSLKGNSLIDGRNLYRWEDVQKAGLQYCPVGYRCDT